MAEKQETMPTWNVDYKRKGYPDISTILEIMSQSSDLFQPSDDTPMPGYFGSEYTKPFPWSERKLRTWGDVPKDSPYRKEKGFENRKDIIEHYKQRILNNGNSPHNNINSLILMNELNGFSPSSEDLKNRTIKNFANTVGSISPQPQYANLNEEVFDIISGLSPLGNISKKTAQLYLSGGRSIKSPLDQLLDLGKKFRIRLDNQNWKKFDKEYLSQLKAENKQAGEIMQLQKILKKHNINIPDADEAFDSIDKYLNKLGFTTPKQTLYKK